MKRLYILLSALLVLLVFGFAAIYTVPQTTPPAEDIAPRPLSSEADAIACAKALWQSGYLLENLDGLAWYAYVENGNYYVTASGDEGELYSHFSHEGVVSYLYNGLSRFDETPLTEAPCEPRQDDLTQYLLAFIEALHPGGTGRIKGFEKQLEAVTYPDRIFNVLKAYDDNNGKADTYTLFVVQVSPQLRVVSYSAGIPVNGSG